MNIVKATEINTISKPEGIDVRYYLFNDYELHYNEQAPSTTQSWHHHEKIWETLYIVEGSLVVEWREGGEVHSNVVSKGDLIETGRTPHTFINKSDKTVKFIVIKRIPSDQDFREIFRNYKVLD